VGQGCPVRASWRRRPTPAGWRAAEQAAIILAKRSVVQADLYIGAIVVLGKTRAHPQASIGPPRGWVTSLGPTPGATTPEKRYEPSSTTTGLIARGVLGYALFSLDEPGLRARRCADVRAFLGVERRNGAIMSIAAQPHHDLIDRPLLGLVVATKAPLPLVDASVRS
jgi:hypothetical protein